MEVVKFIYNETPVDFEPSGKANLMVNATQMAKIFGKKIENFTRIETTQNFISSCLKNANKRYLGIEKEEDLIKSKQKSGTWMHRILALKFAAWLDPAFELWIFLTIDQILFGESIKYKQILGKKAEIQFKKDKVIKILEQNPEYMELMDLTAQEMRLGKESHSLDKEVINQQLTLIFEAEETKTD